MSVPLNKSLYEKVKEEVYARYDKPSAYRSMAVVKEYKERGGKYKSVSKDKPLKRWQEEEWTNIADEGQYPVLRPSKRVSKKTPLTIDEIPAEELKRQIKKKQKIKGESNLSPFVGRGKILIEKPTELLQNEVVKTAHKFAVSNKIKVIGSNAMRGLLYPSDLDFISEFHQRPKALASELKKVFSDKKFMLSIYFMDFKCGLDTRFAPYKEEERDKWLLRWTPKDVKNGYVKLHDGETKSLEDCLLDNTIIKIDWIYRQPLVECSLNIQYKQEPPTKEEEIATLKEDINEYLKTNTMKSMKRLYSLLVLTKKNKPLQKQLVEYFNSPAGIVNKGRNDLVLIQTLLESHPFVDVDTEIQQIKANMGCVPWVSASVLKKMSRKTLDKTIEYLDDLLNKVSKSVLSELNI